MAKILKKRLFSSPEAFRLTLEKHRQTLAGVPSDEKKRAMTKPSMGILRREIEGIEEENADDDASEERMLGAVETGSSALRPTTPEEDAILNELARWAKKASEQLDAKARALIDWLANIVRPNGTWSNTRVIVFTEYRATQNWLQEHLAANGLSQHGRLVTLYGGMDEQKREKQRKLYRVSARMVPSGKPAHPIIVAFARLVVLGADGGKLHEELLTAGAEIKKGKALRIGVKDVAEALGVIEYGQGHDAPPHVRKQLANVWPDHREVLISALEARQRDRVVAIEKSLAERAEKEVADVTAVLEELKKTIERELAKEDAPQLRLFDNLEKEQFTHDREALVTRLEAIPDEIARESAALRARYASPQARLFPVALMYVVPEGSV